MTANLKTDLETMIQRIHMASGATATLLLVLLGERAEVVATTAEGADMSELARKLQDLGEKIKAGEGMPLGNHGQVIEVKAQPGICGRCGCTEERACFDERLDGPCGWADNERTICTACLTNEEFAAMIETERMEDARRIILP